MAKWFRNLKISVKITCGFLLVAVIAGIIGVVGIVSLNQVGGAYAAEYSDAVIALESVERISASFQQIRADLFAMTLADSKSEKEACAQALAGHRAVIDEAIG